MNPTSRIIGAKTDVTCEYRAGGSAIDITNYVPEGYVFSGSSNTNPFSQAFGALSYFLPWIFGVVSSGLGIVLLPFLLRGTVRMNNYGNFLVWVSPPSFILGSLSSGREA
jgi:hypothetical protein